MKNMIIMMYRDGGDVPWSESVYKLAKAEKDSSGNLFIYDYYIHIVSNIGSSTTTYNLYTASDKEEIIDTNADISNMYSNNLNLSETEKHETFVNNLLDFYNDSIVTYKHTFKLNNDNQYYWYSTEPIK